MQIRFGIYGVLNTISADYLLHQSLCLFDTIDGDVSLDKEVAINFWKSSGSGSESLFLNKFLL